MYRIKDKKKSKKIKINALISFFFSRFQARTHFFVDIKIKNVFRAAEFSIFVDFDSNFFLFESEFDSNSSFINFFNLV